MAGNSGNDRLGPRHALAGLQAGILGALLMLAWLMIASLWKRRSVWIVPNLFATTFYGPGAYRNGFMRGSWSGLALILAVYGLGGIVWGVLARGLRLPRAPLYGAAAGLLVYYLFFHAVWKLVNPLIPLYAPDTQLQIGHLLWGFALARSSVYASRIAAAVTEPVPATEVVL